MGSFPNEGKYVSIDWSTKLKVGNTLLHKAALVTHENMSLYAKFWKDLIMFRGRYVFRLFAIIIL